jgi:tetratricopeptide (TPR) repeat protein
MIADEQDYPEFEFGPYGEAEEKALKAFELYETGKMTEALDELESALQIDPANCSWHFNKGLTLDALER